MARIVLLISGETRACRPRICGAKLASDHFAVTWLPERFSNPSARPVVAPIPDRDTFDHSVVATLDHISTYERIMRTYSVPVGSSTIAQRLKRCLWLAALGVEA